MNGKLEGLDKELLFELIDELDKSIRGRNLMVEWPEDFWKELRDKVFRLVNAIGPKHHVDPNVNCIWGIALLTTAWVGCIPKSKLYSPPKERPDELTDPQRQEMAKWLKELSISISAIYSLGYDLAAKLRERRGQQNYTSWETIA